MLINLHDGERLGSFDSQTFVLGAIKHLEEYSDSEMGTRLYFERNEIDREVLSNVQAIRTMETHSQPYKALTAIREKARAAPRQCKRTNSRSGYAGVHLHKRSGQFSARIYANGQQLCLGTFDTAEEAAHVRDAAAIKYHGEFAFLNFPKVAA